VGDVHLNSRIPFDIFQRYMLVKEIIDAIEEDRKTTILDAGGYPGVVSDFFSMDENLKEYVECGLPNLGELRDFLDSNRLVHVEFSNGHLGNWLFTQALNSRS